jgi:DNA-binding NtrC family response regulator
LLNGQREQRRMGTLRILVVDDEEGIREGLKTLLGRQGYDVRTAGDAWGALRWIKRAPFDCLLIDMDLTRDSELSMNGLDVIALLRIHQPGAQAILMSASDDSALTRLAQERGAVARLEKPLDLAFLTHLLRSLFPLDAPTTPSNLISCHPGKGAKR